MSSEGDERSELPDAVAQIVEEGEDRQEPPVEVGQVVCGRFELRERRGDGGSAVTFVAHDALMEQLVALKIARSATPDDKQRFLDQIAKLGRLHSDSLPAFLGYFEHEVGGVRYPSLCLELVSGEALGTYLAKGDEAACLDILRQLALALDELDQVEMRHGDLTTENVLVRDGVPVLIDPDSTGKASDGKRYSGSDFEPFAAIVRSSKVAVAYPDIAVALGNVDRTVRPFVAAAKILTQQLRPVLARQASLRLREVRDAYRNESAEVEGRYANLLRLRRATFIDLVNVVAEDCRFVGLELDPPTREQEQRDAADEMALISKAAGILKACTRTFRSREGHSWTLELLSRSGFRVSKPFPDPSVRGEVSSAVHTLEDSALVEERLRIRVDGDGQAVWELQSLEGWTKLPEGWSTRLIEILVAARVPALPTGHLVQSVLSSADVPSSQDLDDAVRADLEGRSSSPLAESLDELGRAPRPDWPESLRAVFRDFFLQTYGHALLHLDRFDLARIDGCWHLDFAGTARKEGQPGSWLFSLPWLALEAQRALNA